jgi:hypothetical protein
MSAVRSVPRPASAVLPLRQAIAGILNFIAGRETMPDRIEHRSFERHEIDREQSEHMGPGLTQMEHPRLQTGL